MESELEYKPEIAISLEEPEWMKILSKLIERGSDLFENIGVEI